MSSALPLAPIGIEYVRAGAVHAPAGHDIQVHDPLVGSGWDPLLARCPNASFYHSSAWARVLHETYGFRPYYLVHGPSAAPHAVLPVMEVRSAWTGARGISLPFSDECEPSGMDTEAYSRLLQAAQRLGIERGWRYLETRGTGKVLPPARASLRYHGHRAALEPDESAMFRRVDSSVRRAVRKAERSGLTVEITDARRAVREFYELFCVTRRRHGLPPQPYSFHDNIRRHVLTRGQGAIVLVRLPSGTAVAGALFLHGAGSVVMKFAASDLRYQHLRINNLALWAAMKHYGRSGYRTMDFGRTSWGNEGLRRFKQRWGAEEHEIHYHRYDFRALDYVQSQDAAVGGGARLFHHLPVSISQLVGTLFYRHIA